MRRISQTLRFKARIIGEFYKSPMNAPSFDNGFRYFISGVEAWLPAESSSFVIIGDSITDGRGSTTNANNR
jgi:hypothetical protein